MPLGAVRGAVGSKEGDNIARREERERLRRMVMKGKVSTDTEAAFCALLTHHLRR